MPGADLHRVRVLYSGRVQGVGFRFTVAEIAQSHVVAGHVRNLADGRVEVLAEGTSPDLDAFLQAVRESRLERFIEREQVCREPVVRPLSGFAIRS